MGTQRNRAYPAGGIRSALNRIVSQGRIRLHTPGHQGQPPAGEDWLSWQADLTEVEGLGPEHIRRSERAAATLFGSRRTWYSTQGATLPVLAAVTAAAAGRRRLWIDRGSHRAVYAAMVWSRAEPRWLSTQTGPGGLPLPTPWPGPREGPAVGADPVILTRPTYDGLAWPPAPLPRRGPWVVDEAHGSHWNRADGYPTPALAMGIDLVCHGVHKTEPALTQTGLLHLQGRRLSASRVQQYWEMFATTSPSYLLLASLEAAVVQRRDRRTSAAWARLARQAPQVWERLETAGYFVLQAWWRRRGGQADPAKLTVVGLAVPQALRRDGIEPEKTTGNSVTLVLTPTTDLDAVLACLLRQPKGAAVDETVRPWPPPRTVMPAWEAIQAPGRWVPWHQARGRVARGFVVPYPPGVPLLVPGEAIDQAVLDELAQWLAADTVRITGAGFRNDGGKARAHPGGGYLWVIE